MDELLETAKKYLHSGKPDVALSVLKQSGNEKPEYIQLMTICRNMLSEQYVYIIKENLNRNQLAEAQKVILQYQENLGSSATIQNFIKEIEQKESADGGLLYRLSKVPLKKITKIVTALFIVMTVLFVIWGYLIGGEEINVRGFVSCGSVAGLSIQCASFILYLSLSRNVIWRIDQRKLISNIFVIGFFLVLLSLLLESYSIVSLESCYWGIPPALSTWNFGVAIKFAFAHWEVGLCYDLLTFAVGILNIASVALYITAFSMLSKFGNNSYRILYHTGIIFLSFQLALLIFPYSDDLSVIFVAIMFMAFILWCRFFVVLHKIIYLS